MNRRSPLDLESLLSHSDNESSNRGFSSLPSSPLPQRCSSIQKLTEVNENESKVEMTEYVFEW